jgi:hypothetical protein
MDGRRRYARVARFSLAPLVLAGALTSLGQSLYATVALGALLWAAFLIAFGLDRPFRLAVAAALSGSIGVAWFAYYVPAMVSDGRCGVDGGTVYCPGLFDAYSLALYGLAGVGLTLGAALIAMRLPLARLRRAAH